MVQPKMLNQNWESRFEIEFLEFDGSLDHEEFVDWLNEVEEIFACYDIQESKKVKLATANLRGKARSWWEKMKIERLRKRKTKIHTWEKMNQKLREQFLAYNYSHTLYSKVKIQDVHFLHNDWTILEAFSRALLIENQKVKGAQLAPFTFRISARSGATFNFTMKVEN